VSGFSRKGIEGSGSESQAGLAGTLRQRPHPSVVLVAAAIEHAGLHARLLRALGQHLASPTRLFDRLQLPKLGLDPRDGDDRPRGVVVDQLRHDAAIGAEDREPRALGAPAHLRPHPAAAAKPPLLLR
jgi:hypothetical protein